MWLKVMVFLVAVVVYTTQDGRPVKAKASDSSVKVRVQVELRGVLVFAEKEVILLVQEPEFNAGILAEVSREQKWVLDLDQAKDLRKKAKSLHGKTVIVKGSAILLGLNTQTFKYKGAVPAVYPAIRAPDLIGTRTTLNLEHKVEVNSLTAALK